MQGQRKVCRGRKREVLNNERLKKCSEKEMPGFESNFV